MIGINGLTEMQERFCRFYLDCSGNASEAYRMAYGTDNQKPETVWSNASRTLAIDKVKQRIEELREQRAEETKLERKKVEQILMDIVTADPAELYYRHPMTGQNVPRHPSQLSQRSRNALKKMTVSSDGNVTYEFYGKVEAAKVLAFMNGWNAPQQVSVIGSDGSEMKELRIGFDDDI